MATATSQTAALILPQNPAVPGIDPGSGNRAMLASMRSPNDLYVDVRIRDAA